MSLTALAGLSPGGQAPFAAVVGGAADRVWFPDGSHDVPARATGGRLVAGVARLDATGRVTLYSRDAGDGVLEAIGAWARASTAPAARRLLGARYVEVGPGGAPLHTWEPVDAADPASLAARALEGPLRARHESRQYAWWLGWGAGEPTLLLRAVPEGEGRAQLAALDDDVVRVLAAGPGRPEQASGIAVAPAQGPFRFLTGAKTPDVLTPLAALVRARAAASPELGRLVGAVQVRVGDDGAAEEVNVPALWVDLDVAAPAPEQPLLDRLAAQLAPAGPGDELVLHFAARDAVDQPALVVTRGGAAAIDAHRGALRALVGAPESLRSPMLTGMVSVASDGAWELTVRKGEPDALVALLGFCRRFAGAIPALEALGGAVARRQEAP